MVGGFFERLEKISPVFLVGNGLWIDHLGLVCLGGVLMEIGRG